MSNPLDFLVASGLCKQGWTRSSPNDSAIAYKYFDTVVGPKIAHAYLYPECPETGMRMLKGDYQSEGRNILVGATLCIPADGRAILSIFSQAEAFSKEVSAYVAQSYAARLLQHCNTF